MNNHLIMRILLAFILLATSAISVFSQDALSLGERKLIYEINTAVATAGKSYAAGDFDAAGQSISKAIAGLAKAATGSPAMAQELEPAIKRIEKAHTMLEFEGVSLPPIVRPRSSAAAQTKKPEMDAAKPEMESATAPTTPSSPPTPPAANDPLSFVNSVAPILANRCGRCHISGSRGGFSLATFAALMKGPPEGVVIFPGDNVGSRLIETIETGDMPRGGGRVTAPELKILKDWVTAGAKFDGTDPTLPITAGGPASPAESSMPSVVRSTGKETVSFAKDVAGLLVDNCNGCHIDAMQTRGGLRMDSFSQLLRGGDSGAIIQPGNGDGSLLVKKLRGIEGQQMPAGGRPALPDDQIQLIAKWIDEGATFDGASENQSLRTMSQLAWANAATPAELSKRRLNDAKRNAALVVGDSSSLETIQTDHFQIIGASSAATLQLVAEIAEEQMKTVRSVVSAPSGEEFFNGKATLFVMPRRYDYSEFARMVESRSIPSDWTSHWKFDGIDAYVSLVATDRDEGDAIQSRLVSPLTALAIATRGGDVPRWFAEGIGTVTATRKAKLQRDQRLKLEQETARALTAMKNAKEFLGGKMSPEQTDRIGAAIANTMLDRSQRRSYDGLVRSLGQGMPFEKAFMAAFRGTPEAYINNWLKYVRR